MDQTTRAFDPAFDPAFDIARQPVVLQPDLRMLARTMSDTFYNDLDRDFNGFAGCTLISRFRFDAPWPTWEMHPAGDELVMLLDGRCRLLIRDAGGERQVRLEQAGAFVIVPAAAWHTAEPDEPTTLLFVTPGAGTENRPAEALPPEFRRPG